jgi:hypothetical protein
LGRRFEESDTTNPSSSTPMTFHPALLNALASLDVHQLITRIFPPEVIPCIVYQ